MEFIHVTEYLDQNVCVLVQDIQFYLDLYSCVTQQENTLNAEKQSSDSDILGTSLPVNCRFLSDIFYLLFRYLYRVLCYRSASFLFQNEPKPSSVRWLVRCGAVHSGYCSFYTFWATGNTAACFQCFLCSVFVSQLQSRSTLMQEQWNTSLKVIPRQLAQNPELLSWIFLNKMNV